MVKQGPFCHTGQCQNWAVQQSQIRALSACGRVVSRQGKWAEWRKGAKEATHRKLKFVLHTTMKMCFLGLKFFTDAQKTDR